MQQEVDRTDATPDHIAACQAKLDVLKQQHIDLSTGIEELLADYVAGNKYMRVYKQMKMYNDESLNPVLYANKK